MPLKYINTNTVKEHHGKPIFCVAFNTYDPANQDLVASVGGYQATVYRCHPQGRIEVLQVYVDDHTQRLNGETTGEEEDFYCCKWTIERASREPLLLLAGKLGLLRVVNCITNSTAVTLKGHGKEINDINVHPQHPHLVLTASKDHSIRLWNIAAGCCVLLMWGPGAHAGDVFTLDFHPWDPFLFVSGAMEGAVKVWSLKEHWSTIRASEEWNEPPEQRAFPVRLVAHPLFSSRHVHNNYVDCCRWLGDLVLSKSVDYTIKLWRPLYPENPILETSSKFEVLQVFEQPGDPDPLRWVRFSTDPCGHVLSCGNINGRTYVWEPGMGRPHRGVLLAHKQCTRVVRQTAVSMDASMIICSTEDSMLWRWDRQGALTQQQQAAQQQQQQHASSSRRNSRAVPEQLRQASSSKERGEEDGEEQQQQQQVGGSVGVAGKGSNAEEPESGERQEAAAAATPAAAAVAGVATGEGVGGSSQAAKEKTGSMHAAVAAAATAAAAAAVKEEEVEAGEHDPDLRSPHSKQQELQPMQVDEQQQQRRRRLRQQRGSGAGSQPQAAAAQAIADVIVIDSDSDSD